MLPDRLSGLSRMRRELTIGRRSEFLVHTCGHRQPGVKTYLDDLRTRPLDGDDTRLETSEARV